MAPLFKYSQIHHDFFNEFGEECRYKKGYILVDSSSKASYVYFLKKGIIKATFSSANGDERVLGFFFPGTTFAQSGSFFDNPTSGIVYELVETSDLLRVKSEIFFHQLRANNEFSMDYLQTVLRNNLFLIERVIYQGEKDIKSKFIKWLLFMAKFYGIEGENSSIVIPIPMTQDTIASFMHTSRESINKTILTLKQQNYISIDRKKITIFNIHLLRKSIRNF